MRTATAPVEFNEGLVTLGDSVWFCTDHETTMKAGKDCPFCAHENMTPAEFETWIATQR